MIWAVEYFFCVLWLENGWNTSSYGKRFCQSNLGLCNNATYLWKNAFLVSKTSGLTWLIKHSYYEHERHVHVIQDNIRRQYSSALYSRFMNVEVRKSIVTVNSLRLIYSTSCSFKACSYRSLFSYLQVSYQIWFIPIVQIGYQFAATINVQLGLTSRIRRNVPV